jgi:hypothetical protein
MRQAFRLFAILGIRFRLLTAATSLKNDFLSAKLTCCGEL